MKITFNRLVSVIIEHFKETAKKCVFNSNDTVPLSFT